MRTIKFRWWDKVEDEMIDWEQISPLGQEDFTEETELRAMQFSGIKDKKGIDIYEGDIVDYRCKSQPDKRDLRIVKFHENGFFSATGGYDINLYAIKDAVTVVGNIYENPELLSTPTAVL